MSFVKILVASFFAILLSACAYTPHNVAVSATAPTISSGIGTNVTTRLVVLDDRDDLTVGQRAVAGMGADISATSLIETFTREVRLGLQAQGFTVVDEDATAPSEIEVRLRAFKYYVEEGFWSGGENISTVVAVEANRDEAKYRNVYRSSDEKRIQAISSGDRIDRLMNAALSEVLSQIMRDKKLMNTLAGRTDTAQSVRE